MSSLFQQFTLLPEFVDYRQDQFNDVVDALTMLNTLPDIDPNLVLEVLRSANVDQVSTNYAAKWRSTAEGNFDLYTQVHSISYRPCARVAGVLNYV